MVNEFRDFLRVHGGMISDSGSPSSILKYIQITYEEVSRLHKRVSKFLHARHSMIINQVSELANLKADSLEFQLSGNPVVDPKDKIKFLHILKEYKSNGCKRILFTTNCDCLNAYIVAANVACEKIRKTREMEHNRAFRFLKIVRNVYSHDQDVAKAKYMEVACKYWNDDYSQSWDDGLFEPESDRAYSWFANSCSLSDVSEMTTYFRDIAAKDYDITFK